MEMPWRETGGITELDHVSLLRFAQSVLAHTHTHTQERIDDADGDWGMGSDRRRRSPVDHASSREARPQRRREVRSESKSRRVG